MSQADAQCILMAIGLVLMIVVWAHLKGAGE